VDENCALLGHYAVNGGKLLPTFRDLSVPPSSVYVASSGNLVPTARDNISVPPSRVRVKKMGLICCPETSVINYHCSLRNDPEEHSPHLIILRLIVWVTDVK
jgi:hypothetical protein